MNQQSVWPIVFQKVPYFAWNARNEFHAVGNDRELKMKARELEAEAKQAQLVLSSKVSPKP
ncbi:unnamed protein product [Coffea canephora]|uniref:Uncharacterized protein n=1 Tax=Coffea canephora TaxID=49390 RepID=A0A068UEZ9_COFCA|nr:unnamed protein product [Coffea canephora]